MKHYSDIALIQNNARVGAEIAVELSELSSTDTTTWIATPDKTVPVSVLAIVVVAIESV